MHLTRLRIHRLRNLDTELGGLGAINVFYGANGSGKTSVLEAIHLLGLGRSFRSPSARSVITYEHEGLSVFAEQKRDGQINKLGVSRDKQGGWQMRRNGEPVKALAEMARELPVLLVNSDTFALLEGAPRVRRQFLDWGVFHVEQAFYPAWKTAIRCLKHRNKLLRHDKIARDELAAWDAPLAAAAETIRACRERYWQSLQATLDDVREALGVLPGLSVRHTTGWEADRPFAEVLAANLERDRAQRQTTQGPHRADLVFRVGALPAAETLSRGQKKAAILALRLAQAQDLVARGACTPLLLLDDLPAELDEGALGRVLAWVNESGLQAFITAVSPQVLAEGLGNNNDTCWFHVEHGGIRAAEAPNSTENARHDR